MIPKAEILAAAKFQELLPTTVQKDYVLGWLLRSIAEHPALSEWAFKGGTCLKKCFFETYRFSEDLDFTIPKDQRLSVDQLKSHLDAVAGWIESRSGLTFPREYWKIEEYKNPHGKDSYEVRIPYAGLIGQPAKSLQKVKFDLTQDELLVDSPQKRTVHHGYTDAANLPPMVLCYTIDEILAEKTRALVQRNGRSRDVYDVVNISRNFRDSINPESAREIASRKFQFRNLPPPTVNRIMEAIDEGVLKANWQQELAHQINVLAPVETFLADSKGLDCLVVTTRSGKAPIAANAAGTGTKRPSRAIPQHHLASRSSRNGSNPVRRPQSALRDNNLSRFKSTCGAILASAPINWKCKPACLGSGKKRGAIKPAQAIQDTRD